MAGLGGTSTKGPRYFSVMDSDGSGLLRGACGLRRMRVSNVPDDPRGGEDHREAEDLGHERLGRAAEEEGAHQDARDRSDSHDRAEAGRYPTRMPEGPMRQVRDELSRDRDEGTQSPGEHGRDPEEEDQGGNSIL